MDDDFVNDLAISWYFLNLQLSSSEVSKAQLVVDELIDLGLKLKDILKSGGFMFLEPLNIYVDSDTYFDIWIDADDDIQFSELYCEND